MVDDLERTILENVQGPASVEIPGPELTFPPKGPRSGCRLLSNGANLHYDPPGVAPGTNPIDDSRRRATLTLVPKSRTVE